MTDLMKFDGVETRLMNEEEKAEYEADQLEFAKTNWIRNRLNEYPNILECIHAILDDDLEALQKKRHAVKAKYPKK